MKSDPMIKIIDKARILGVVQGATALPGLIVAALTLAMAAPATSHAQPALAALPACDGTPSRELRANLISRAQLALSPTVLAALETSSLGDYLQSAQSQSQDGEGAEHALLKAAEGLFETQGNATSTEASASDLARRFLNGETALLDVACQQATIPFEAQPLTLRAMDARYNLPLTTITLPPLSAPTGYTIAPRKRPWQQIMIARRKADIIKSARDRGSATFGIERDRAQGFDTINIETTLATEPFFVVEAGAVGPDLTPTRVEFLPFLQYNRRSARVAKDGINDLTLGFSAIARNPAFWGGAIGFGSLAWQSDDQGRASVLIGDAQVDFKTVPACERLDLWQWDTRCNAGLVLDFASVEEAGQSARLQLLDRYFRVGLNAEMVSERSFPFGVVRLTSNYVTRYDLAQNGAGGGLGTLTLGLRETRASNVSLEAGYSRGRTLNTLVDVDKVTLRIGYRR